MTAPFPAITLSEASSPVLLEGSESVVVSDSVTARRSGFELFLSADDAVALPLVHRRWSKRRVSRAQKAITCTHEGCGKVDSGGASGPAYLVRIDSIRYGHRAQWLCRKHHGEVWAAYRLAKRDRLELIELARVQPGARMSDVLARREAQRLKEAKEEGSQQTMWGER